MLRGDHGRMIEFLAAKEKFVDLNLFEKIFEQACILLDIH